MQKINYAIFYLFALFVILLPRYVRVKFFTFLAYLVYKIDVKHRFIIKANLDFALGNSITKDRKAFIQRHCFTNLFLEILSVIESYFISTKRIEKKIVFVGTEHIEKAHAQGKPIVFFTGHYNDLEIGGIALGLVVQSVHIVQEASNPYIHRFINKGREKAGLKMVTMQKALRAQTKQLKEGGDVSIVVDQSISGTYVDFFGHKTLHGIAASKLALKFDAVLIPAMVLKTPDNRPQATFFEPISFTPTGDDKVDIQTLTQAQATFIENIIRQNPEPWFWCHKRWKDTNPELYDRKGK